jgi:hypothetical protein
MPVNSCMKRKEGNKLKQREREREIKMSGKEENKLILKDKHECMRKEHTNQ